MSRGIWVCHECNHKVKTSIGRVYKECPKCGSKHEIIATVKGLHVVHVIPIYKSVKEPIENCGLNKAIGFASGNGKINFHCYTKEAYEYLKNKLKNKENVEVTMKKEKSKKYPLTPEYNKANDEF